MINFCLTNKRTAMLFLLDRSENGHIGSYFTLINLHTNSLISTLYNLCNDT